MADPMTLGLGLFLGFVFVFFMVYVVLPRADHMVKKELGPAEACCATRFCCLCIALPLYVFAIWMTTVFVFGSDKGISVLQDICPEDYSCTRAFAMGRENFDKDVCVNLECTPEELYARSGSQPLDFPRLGLGQDLEITLNGTVSYTCTEFNASSGHCAEAKSGGEECLCEDVLDLEGEGNALCGYFAGCDDDLIYVEHETNCLTLSGGKCTEWEVHTDSAKQFSIQVCTCSSEDCGTFTCETLTMEYFYPNVFYAGLVAIMFIFPLMVIVYILCKTQIKKILPCGEADMYVYGQDAGVQKEARAEDFVTGGFAQSQEEKTKMRTGTCRDICAIICLLFLIYFFSWCTVISAGRVGLSFIMLSACLILVVELYLCFSCCRKRCNERSDRYDMNN